MRKPFFRKQNSTWYCWHNGKQVRLSKDKATAFDQWHRLNAGRREFDDTQPVGELIVDFLEWTKAHKAPATYRWYCDFLNSFADHIGGEMIHKIRAYHIEAWIDDCYPESSDTSKNGAIRAVSRVFNWAKARQITDVQNPTKGMERPSSQPRQSYVSPGDWRRLIDSLDEDDALRDFLIVLRETGCRPDEARKVEARNVDRAGSCWHFESGKGGKPRTVPLTPTALAVTERLMLRHPEGPIFRNSRGGPWKASALTYRFNNLPVDVTPYAIRHTFITDALVNGVDPVTLAEIVGHQTLDMIQRVYQKLRMRQDHMRESVQKAVGENHGLKVC